MRRTGLCICFMIMLQTGCDKDDRIANRPPIAKAGEYLVLTLPENATQLDGSESFDPDGMIGTYSWKKISGPPLFKLNHADAPNVMVSEMVEGVYVFELEVTDDGGATGKDSRTVVVNRKGESIQFNNLPPAGSPCFLKITNYSDQLPLIFSFDVYIRRWYEESSSAVWMKIDSIPDLAINSSLPPNSYWYWYEVKGTDLIIHYPGNILCDWDGAFHDVYIRYD
ncbi:PKD domain-containing protein [Paracnuella aquatica]|uniref:PKD domain-containing protein n=1 Tax=Paracnuella aquatica TaxID=2268757 RepID=UPI000F5155E1|nr:hypothetical protein [Paracnuella aquatica]RPD51970.1 hypothetical protein DRJ53_04645 [Paracnuella aquatica]